MQTKTAMEVKNLSFSYGKNKILRDVSFAIGEGEITTIMGANGCGKSTSKKGENLFGRKEYTESGAEGFCKEGVYCTPV